MKDIKELYAQVRQISFLFCALSAFSAFFAV